MRTRSDRPEADEKLMGPDKLSLQGVSELWWSKSCRNFDSAANVFIEVNEVEPIHA